MAFGSRDLRNSINQSNKDWKGFARGYNGPAYWKNMYDTKLKNAYLKYSLQ